MEAGVLCHGGEKLTSNDVGVQTPMLLLLYINFLRAHGMPLEHAVTHFP